eukprot:m.74134 g.74134  ORF g.74134 m.74134 type:complete len:224 (-) comp24625_c1_seq1:65-736(-)
MSRSLLDKRVDLNLSANEREEYDQRKTMYTIIRQLEFLEKANSQGVFSQTKADEERYGVECDKLLKQYKNSVQWMPGDFNLDAFVARYKVGGMAAGAVKHRIDIGVNSNVELGASANKDGGSKNFVGFVMEATAAFITILDLIALDRRSTAELQPELTGLLRHMNKIPTLPPDFSGKAKIKTWLATFSGMTADEALDDTQAQQLQFDLTSEFDSFKDTVESAN